MTRERLAALVKEYNDTYWNGEDDEQLISLLERVAEEASLDGAADSMLTNMKVLPSTIAQAKAEQREADAKIVEGRVFVGCKMAQAIRDAK